VFAHCADGELVLHIIDNGPGLPPDFDADQTGGFGMRMIRSVLVQAEGRLTYLTGRDGAECEVVVPLATSEPGQAPA
jgi:two-component sensor histidine kinase